MYLNIYMYAYIYVCILYYMRCPHSPSVIVQVLVTIKKYINGRAVIPHHNVT